MPEAGRCEERHPSNAYGAEGFASDSSSVTFLAHHPSTAWSRQITFSLSSTREGGLGFNGSIRSACRPSHSTHSNTFAPSSESVFGSPANCTARCILESARRAAAFNGDKGSESSLGDLSHPNDYVRLCFRRATLMLVPRWRAQVLLPKFHWRVPELLYRKA